MELCLRAFGYAVLMELWDHGSMSTNADRPRAKSLNPLRSLLPFLTPYRAMMAAALGALLVATVAMLALPVALRQLIDHGLAAKDAGTINQYFKIGRAHV